MNRNVLYSIVTFALVSVFCLFTFEATARFFEEMDRYVVTKEFDPVIGWRLKPGRHFVRPSGKLQKVQIDINSFALRGAEFSAKPETNEKRIMVLGDSFVFARHFPLHEAFTGRLEKILSAGSDHSVRVINAGVPGYGTGQELLFMRKLADESGIVPDAYILMIFSNDILDNLRLSYDNFEEVAVKPGFDIDASGKAVIKAMPVNNLDALQESFRRPLKSNFWEIRLVRFVRQTIAGYLESHHGVVQLLLRLGIKLKLPRKPGLLSGWYDDQVVNKGFPIMKALIQEMKAEAEKRGASFSAVIIPSPVQIYPEVYQKILQRQFPGDYEVNAWIADPLKAQKLITSMCSEIQVNCLDLYPVFKANLQQKLYIPRDGHFDRDGHEIVAASIAQWIGAASESQIPAGQPQEAVK